MTRLLSILAIVLGVGLWVRADSVVYEQSSGTKTVYVPAVAGYIPQNQPAPVAIQITRPSGAIGQWVPASQPTTAPVAVPAAQPNTKPTTSPVVVPPPRQPPVITVPSGGNAEEAVATCPAGGSVLLERGGVWSGQEIEIRQSMTLADYGDPAKAPPLIIPPPDGTAVTVVGASDVTVRNIDAVPIDRDPAKPNFRLAAKGYGFRACRSCARVTFDTCRPRLFVWNFSFDTGTQTDVTVLNAISLDAWGAGADLYGGQGLYAENVVRLVIRGGTFDHNGFNEAIPQTLPRNAYRHDLYLNGPMSGVGTAGALVDGVFLSRPATIGAKMAGAGTIQNCFIYDAGIAIVGIGQTLTVNNVWIVGGHHYSDGTNYTGNSVIAQYTALLAGSGVTALGLVGQGLPDPGGKTANMGWWQQGHYTAHPGWQPLTPPTSTLTGVTVKGWPPFAPATAATGTAPGAVAADATDLINRARAGKATAADGIAWAKALGAVK